MGSNPSISFFDVGSHSNEKNETKKIHLNKFCWQQQLSAFCDERRKNLIKVDIPENVVFRKKTKTKTMENWEIHLSKQKKLLFSSEAICD
jgi:hypothetical protein